MEALSSFYLPGSDKKESSLTIFLFSQMKGMILMGPHRGQQKMSKFQPIQVSTVTVSGKFSPIVVFNSFNLN